MKSTGIVRNIDHLGRVVIPVELRKSFDLKVEDGVEIYVSDNNEIVLKKYEPTCVFCKGTRNLLRFNDRLICRHCLEKINDMAKEDVED